MSNLEIGKRIRTLRTEKGLSKEAFCGDEKELTVRQLGRIETGNNLPSLAKLDYIAEVLGIPMSRLKFAFFEYLSRNRPQILY